jgi:UDP-GlcNAc:undecaprenyl-phosphate GlcNAc-1-phosphate transferase
MVNLLIIEILLNLVIFLNYSKIAKIYNVYDIPDNLRKHHKYPTPLLGGLIIYFNIFILFILFHLDFFESIFFQSKYEINLFFISVTFLFVIGFIDDKYNISANKKLLILIFLIYFLTLFDNNFAISHLNFSFYNKKLLLNIFSIPITILCFLLFMNAYNMLDGINCQAASYTIFIFFIFIFNKVSYVFFFNLVIFLLFFLYFNYKNRMFLGNSGSLLLSYIIGYFVIKSYNSNNTFYSDEIFLIMSIPGYELLRLAIQRIYNKKHPFFPDNNHIHHYVIKKYKFINTFFILQFLLISPYLTYLVYHQFLFSFFFSVFFYIFLINLFYEKKYVK